MTAFSELEAKAIAGSFDFARFESVVDLGGGQGLLLSCIKSVAPKIAATLFELPPVVERIRNAGAKMPFELVAGDLFASVPNGADIYILKNILHDFPDALCIKALRNCATAMRPASRVLIAQEVLPGANRPSMGKLLDLQMLLIGGRERAEEEYRTLVEAAGLRIMAVHPIPGPLHLIEAAL